MPHKAKCIKASITKSGLMFVLDEVYLVEKSNSVTLGKYVIVAGIFTNSHKELHKLKRIISKELCQKHLKIV